MRQDFQHVTAGQLAELFPVLLTGHEPEWAAYYQAEKVFLQSVFQDKIMRIHHIGNTAVPGLLAKPTIDILLEVAEDCDLRPFTERMLDEGYVVNTPGSDLIMYLKGYTPQGFQGQAVHIHVRRIGDWGELYFRDYLIAYPQIQAEYAKLKLLFKSQYPNDRDAYTLAKGPFVQKYTEQARVEFGERYDPAALAK